MLMSTPTYSTGRTDTSASGGGGSSMDRGEHRENIQRNEEQRLQELREQFQRYHQSRTQSNGYPSSGGGVSDGASSFLAGTNTADPFYNALSRELERTRNDLNEAVNEVTYCEERSKRQNAKIALLKKGLHLHNERAIKCLVHIQQQFEPLWENATEDEIEPNGPLRVMQKAIRVAFKSMHRYNEQINKMLEVGDVKHVHLDSKKLTDKLDRSFSAGSSNLNRSLSDSSQRVSRAQQTGANASIDHMMKQESADASEETSAGDIAAKYNQGGHAYQELSAKYQVCEQAYHDVVKEHEEMKARHEKHFEELKQKYQQTIKSLSEQLRDDWIKERRRADRVETERKALEEERTVLENALDRFIDMPVDQLNEAVSAAKQRVHEAGQATRQATEENQKKDFEKKEGEQKTEINSATLDIQGAQLESGIKKADSASEQKSGASPPVHSSAETSSFPEGSSKVFTTLNEMETLCQQVNEQIHAGVTNLDDSDSEFASSDQLHSALATIRPIFTAINSVSEKMQTRIRYLRECEVQNTEKEGTKKLQESTKSVEALHLEVCEQKKINQQQRFRIQDLESQLSSFESEVNKLSSKRKQLTTALEKAITSLEGANEHTRVLAQRETVLKKRCDGYQERLELAQQEAEKFEDERRDYDRRIQELKGKLAETESAYERRVRSLEQGSSHLEAELQSTKEERDQYYDDAQQATDDLRAVLDQAEETSDERDQLESRLSRLTVELESLRSERESNFNYSDTKEVKRLQRQNDELENNVRQCRYELQQQKGLTAQAEAKVTELEKEIDSLKRKNDLLEQETEDLKKELETRDEKLSEEARRRGEETERADKLDELVEEEKQRRRKLEQEASNLRQRIESMEGSLTDIHSDLCSVVPESKENGEQYPEEQTTIDAITQKITTLKKEMSKWKESCLAYERQINELHNVSEGRSQTSTPEADSPSSFRGQLSPDDDTDTRQLKGDISDVYDAVQTLESRLRQAQHESSTLQKKVSSRSLNSREGGSTGTSDSR
eukprot:gb/GECG01005559.1/.p1 GENE.gb/GECG01005559.1/~~gb/GECG01005559.1/.p1  ORF type:complete len:1017 (+),score=220.63 gb/GECG01005559.1/:1-3051(+)